MIGPWEWRGRKKDLPTEDEMITFTMTRLETGRLVEMNTVPFPNAGELREAVRSDVAILLGQGWHYLNNTHKYVMLFGSKDGADWVVLAVEGLPYFDGPEIVKRADARSSTVDATRRANAQQNQKNS